MRRIWTAEEIEKIYAELVANHRTLLAKHIYGELTEMTIDMDVAIKTMNIIDRMYPGYSSGEYSDAQYGIRLHVIKMIGIMY